MAALNVPYQQCMECSEGHVAMLSDVVMMVQCMSMLVPAAAAAQERHSTDQHHHRAHFCGAGATRSARAGQRQHLLTVGAQRVWSTGTGHAGMAERFEMW